MKEKAFANLKHNVIHLNFPNGNQVSTIWGVGSYSENHNIPLVNGIMPNALNGIIPNAIEGQRKKKVDNVLRPFITFMQSNNAEVMITCGDKLSKRLHKKYSGEGSVIGYLNIEEWLDIVNKVASEKKVKK